MLLATTLCFCLGLVLALIGIFLPPGPGLIIALLLLGLAAFLWLQADRLVLHFFRAREVVGRDHRQLSRLAMVQAHRFNLPAPRLYLYEGFFHRAFALSARGRLTFLLERGLVEKLNETELKSLFFTLALTYQRRFTSAQTLGLLLVALLWTPTLRLLALFRSPPRWVSWSAQLLFMPLSRAMFVWSFPQQNWQRLRSVLQEFSAETRAILEANAHLTQPRLGESPALQLAFGFVSSGHSAPEQMILVLEGQRHLFDLAEVKHA